MKPKVLLDCAVWVRPEDRDNLAQHAELVDLEGEGPLSEQDLLEALQGFAGLLKLGNRLPELTRRVLEGAGDLQVVGVRTDRFGAGIDLQAAAGRGIRVIDTDNIASAHPVAEWDLALILLCLRNGAAVYRQMMAGTERWAHAGNEQYVNGELTGRKVGLIGCGHVGQRLVELLAPFRVDLKVCDPYLDDQIAGRLGLVRGDLDEVLAHADILVVQVPLTPKTRGLIGARELDLLGRGKILINCCRGPVVDQRVLTERLERGDLIAGLDVFDPEPLPGDSPLRHMPNVFLSPHIAWYAPNVLHRYFATMAEEFARFFKGEKLRFELTARMVDIRHGRI